MADRITKEQLEEMEYAYDRNEYHRLLAEYADIEAVPYTGYMYFDCAGNYIGDSSDSGVLDLLEAAGVEVSDG